MLFKAGKTSTHAHQITNTEATARAYSTSRRVCALMAARSRSGADEAGRSAASSPALASFCAAARRCFACSIASRRWFTIVHRSNSARHDDSAHHHVRSENQPDRELPGGVVIAGRRQNGQRRRRQHAQRIPHVAETVEPAAGPRGDHRLEHRAARPKNAVQSPGKAQQPRDEARSPQRGVPGVVLLPRHRHRHAHQQQRRQREPAEVVPQQLRRRGRPAEVRLRPALAGNKPAAEAPAQGRPWPISVSPGPPPGTSRTPRPPPSAASRYTRQPRPDQTRPAAVSSVVSSVGGKRQQLAFAAFSPIAWMREGSRSRQ